MNEASGSYFKALTGVRAIAAYMVFIHHYNPFSEQKFGSALHNFASELYAGVTVFFVLSGFLITYRYFDEKDFSFRKYLVNRIARIYPMYIILTIATFLVLAISNSVNYSFVSFFLNITLLRGFFDDFKFTGIAQGWSLTVEETFYILAPLFYILIKRSKLFLLLLPLALFSFGVGLVSVFSEAHFLGFFSSYEFMFDYTFFGRCFEFFIGMCLAIFFRKGISFKLKYHFTYLGILVMIICIYALSVLKGDYEFGLQHPFGKWINALLLSGGISLFFYGLLTEKTFVSKILGSKIFVMAGKSSYAFYLIHVGVIASFVQSIFPNTIVIFLAIVLISIALFKFVEEPLNKAVRNL